MVPRTSRVATCCCLPPRHPHPSARIHDRWTSFSARLPCHLFHWNGCFALGINQTGNGLASRPTHRSLGYAQLRFAGFSSASASKCRRLLPPLSSLGSGFGGHPQTTLIVPCHVQDTAILLLTAWWTGRMLSPAHSCPASQHGYPICNIHFSWSGADFLDILSQNNIQ